MGVGVGGSWSRRRSRSRSRYRSRSRSRTWLATSSSFLSIIPLARRSMCSNLERSCGRRGDSGRSLLFPTMSCSGMTLTLTLLVKKMPWRMELLDEESSGKFLWASPSQTVGTRTHSTAMATNSRPSVRGVVAASQPCTWGSRSRSRSRRGLEAYPREVSMTYDARRPCADNQGRGTY